jgi:uncharacterized membrane protein
MVTEQRKPKMMDMLMQALTIAGLLAILALIALIAKALWEGRGGQELQAEQAFEEAREASEEALGGRKPEPKPGRESDAQRLARVERELAEREDKAKKEKMADLAEREHVIKMREVEEAKPPAPPEPEDTLKTQELEKTRGRIIELMGKAEERYAAGELEESNFKRIMSDYQQQVLDLDVKLKVKGNL